jgi:phosphoribosylanthranilate isomerase
MTVKVKLCGFKKIEDINFAFSQGVDFIGLNNIAVSPRFLNTDDILLLLNKIPLDYRSNIVVLLNHFELEFLKKLKAAGVLYIQSYLLEIEDAELFSLGFKVIKVFSISSAADVDEVKDFDFQNYSYCLLDTKVDGSLGGTGKTFNWQLFSEIGLCLNIDLILAGGLNPENIDKALNETKARFIDLAGGVEEKTGEKSYALIKELISAIKG